MRVSIDEVFGEFGALGALGRLFSKALIVCLRALAAGCWGDIWTWRCLFCS